MRALPLILCLASTPAVARTATPVAQLAAACAACHRADTDNPGIPSVAGRDATGIEQAMLLYRSDAHGSQIMHVVAAALSPDEIAAIAHYLAGSP